MLGLIPRACAKYRGEYKDNKDSQTIARPSQEGVRKVGTARATQRVTPFRRKARIRATETSHFSVGETSNLCVLQLEIG